MPKLRTTSNEERPILAEALRLHDRGLWIVPCDEKVASVKDWPNKRVMPDQLTTALSNCRPRNIAIVLNQSDLMDVEGDGPDAEPNLQALFGGKVPLTPTWRSKRGLHRLFRRPAGLPEKAKLEIDGIEFRIGGRGALSVVPPSVTDGFARHWLLGLSIHDVEPAELPDAVAERLRSSAQPVAEEPGGDADIPEGQRNDRLFKTACKLARSDLSQAAIEAALHAENKARCKRPLPEAEVAVVVKSALRHAKMQTTQTNAQILLSLALADSELWHTPEGIAFATVRRDSHSEHWRVHSGEYRQWLSKRFFDREGTAPGSQTMQDVLNVLEGKARFEGPACPIFIRIAGHEGRVYVDLCDDGWRAVEIDAAGWRIVKAPPVRFRRAKGMLPLATPARGGSVKDLRQFVNVTDGDWPLVIGFAVGALRPNGPYAALALFGEQGSAKSTTAEVLRKSLDPNVALLRRPPRSERDLMIAACNGWVVAFDNCSHLPADLSDAICCLATGGSLATRKLYTDDGETLLAAERPVIVNGIENIVSRSDLLDRSLIVQLPRIEPGKRLDEEVFWQRFAAAQPRIFGALLDAVSAALRNIRGVKQAMTELPRMADFAQWVCAAEAALGMEPGSFMLAYANNRAAASQTALESSPVVTAIFSLLRCSEKPFKGTASDLLDALNAFVTEQERRGRSWPKNARALSGILGRLAPNLRAAGVTIEKTDDRTWLIERAKTQKAQNPRPFQSGSDGGTLGRALLKQGVGLVKRAVVRR